MLSSPTPRRPTTIKFGAEVEQRRPNLGAIPHDETPAIPQPRVEFLGAINQIGVVVDIEVCRQSIDCLFVEEFTDDDVRHLASNTCNP